MLGSLIRPRRVATCYILRMYVWGTAAMLAYLAPFNLLFEVPAVRRVTWSVSKQKLWKYCIVLLAWAILVSTTCIPIALCLRARLTCCRNNFHRKLCTRKSYLFTLLYTVYNRVHLSCKFWWRVQLPGINLARLRSDLYHSISFSLQLQPGI